MLEERKRGGGVCENSTLGFDPSQSRKKKE